MIMCEQFTLHNPKENIVLRKIRERRLSFLHFKMKMYYMLFSSFSIVY